MTTETAVKPKLDAGKPVVCPICRTKNQEQDTFRCPQCGRKHICLRHADPASGWCERCESSHHPRHETTRKAGTPGRIPLPGGGFMEMIWCPPGHFTMGSPSGETCWTNADAEVLRKDNEFPHHVELTRGFWMAKYPVTQAQWKGVMGTDIQEQYDKHPDCHEHACSHGKTAECPMSCVTWEESREFCRRTGLELPTEAQWEYACRAGIQGAEPTGAFAVKVTQAEPYRSRGGGCITCGVLSEEWGTESNSPWQGWDRAHAQLAADREQRARDDDDFFCGFSSDPSPRPVGAPKPNAWGFQDMHGNVREWCLDWIAPYPSGSVTNPTGPASGTARVTRGGCVRDPMMLCRTSFRNQDAPTHASEVTGFRPVKLPFGSALRVRKRKKAPSPFATFLSVVFGLVLWGGVIWLVMHLCCAGR